MLILVLNFLTKIKLGRHTWCARHAARLCVSGPMARGVWTLEFSWFGGSRQTMSLTATSALLMNRGSFKYPHLQSARRPVAHCDEIPMPIFEELPDISDENTSSVEGHEDEEEVVLEEDSPHPFSQKDLNDLVHDLSLSTDSAKLLASRLKEKKTLWQCLHQLIPQQASWVPPFFLYSERLGVLCRYCAASAQAWIATVRTQKCGLFVLTWRWWTFCWENSLASPSTHIFCTCWIVGTMLSITQRRAVLCGRNWWLAKKGTSSTTLLWTDTEYSSHPCT